MRPINIAEFSWIFLNFAEFFWILLNFNCVHTIVEVSSFPAVIAFLSWNLSKFKKNSAKFKKIQENSAIYWTHRCSNRTCFPKILSAFHWFCMILSSKLYSTCHQPPIFFFSPILFYFSFILHDFIVESILLIVKHPSFFLRNPILLFIQHA